VPFLFKKLGGFSKNKAGRLLDGRTWVDMPGITGIKRVGKFHVHTDNDGSKCEPGAHLKE